MRTVVGTSEALKRAESLHTRIGLHPSLIFFEQELFENQISKAIRTLHGDDIPEDKVNSQHFQMIRAINDWLTDVHPIIGL